VQQEKSRELVGGMFLAVFNVHVCSPLPHLYGGRCSSAAVVQAHCLWHVHCVPYICASSNAWRDA
jgi:hypothetical protein